MRNELSQSIGPTCDDTTTCELGRSPIPSGSTSSAAGFPVKTLVTPEPNVDLKALAPVFGGTCTESFAIFNRDSQSWRTSQRCWIEGTQKFSETWPRAGSMVNGKCYRRVPLVPHIHAKECSMFSTLTVVSCEHPGRQVVKPHQQSCLSAELAVRDKWRRGGQLNPNHAAWFMGFPASWTDLEDSETPLSHK